MDPLSIVGSCSTMIDSRQSAQSMPKECMTFSIRHCRWIHADSERDKDVLIAGPGTNSVCLGPAGIASTGPLRDWCPVATGAALARCLNAFSLRQDERTSFGVT